VCAIEKRMVEFANAAQTSLDEIEGTEPSARVVSAEPVQGAPAATAHGPQPLTPCLLPPLHTQSSATLSDRRGALVHG